MKKEKKKRERGKRKKLHSAVNPCGGTEKWVTF